MQVAVKGLEWVEGHLWREAGRPCWLVRRWSLVASPHALEEDVEGVHLLDTERLHTRSEVPIFLSVLRRMSLDTLVPVLSVGRQSSLRDNLDGTVQPKRAIVQVPASLRTWALEAAGIGAQELLQAAGQEDAIWVELDRPCVCLGALVIHDLVPEGDEDMGVHRRMILATDGCGHIALDDNGVVHRLVTLWGQPKALVAEDLPIVASEDAQMASCQLRPEEAKLVAYGHHQSDTEQRWLFLGLRDSMLIVGAVWIGLGVWLRKQELLLGLIVVLLATTMEGKRAIVLVCVAIPLPLGLAALPAKNEVATARSTRLLAIDLLAHVNLLPMQRLLELLERILRAQPGIVVGVRIDAAGHCP
mmetsp:Transcript_89657/g.225504  ORF Transcript_89657/g.225504 Transcript_89657/m.225504 type:complete len:359 (+) Transcript_89657:297-1373(+)